MKTRPSVAALAAFVLLGVAAITNAQTGTMFPSGTATSAGTPSLSPSPPGSTLPAGTPSATPTSNVTPATPPSPGGDVLRGGTVPSGTPVPGVSPDPGGDINFNTSPIPGTNTGMLGAADARYAMKAAQGGMAEVEMATLALKQSNNEQVRSFAQRMLKDHSEMNTQLMRLATARRLVLPDDMSPQDQVSMRYLSRRSGARFDADYLRQQVRAHEQTLALFQEAASSARDPELANFFAMHSGHIADHLAMVKTLAGVP